jgi:hypothetical protein
MPFPRESYDPNTLAVLTAAFNSAWREVQATNGDRPEGEMITTRKMMALRIMDAANQGERDIERLKAVALRSVDGRHFD